MECRRAVATKRDKEAEDKVIAWLAVAGDDSLI
jgi:hypothetical protein